MIAAHNVDRAAFLKFCKSPSVEEIPAAFYQTAMQALKRKAGAK
jgi:hypothetical protein